MTSLLVVGFVLAVAVVVGLWWVYVTANRLDRLHVRYDLSCQALYAALDRRCAVARLVARSVAKTQAQVAQRITDAADRAESVVMSASGSHQLRQQAENHLSVVLEDLDQNSLPAFLVAELADAQTRVSIARRFHDDAVRDTLVLRNRRPVRLFQLAGTAPRPEFFEILEPSQASR